jgi:hypothetical protein
MRHKLAANAVRLVAAIGLVAEVGDFRRFAHGGRVAR